MYNGVFDHSTRKGRSQRGGVVIFVHFLNIFKLTNILFKRNFFSHNRIPWSYKLFLKAKAIRPDHGLLS